MSKLAVIRVRGDVHISSDIRDTFTMLRLGKKHACVVIEDTPTYKGMLQKVKDHVTWGPVNEQMLQVLQTKMGDKKVAHLHPPRGGFERKGIKISYQNGGVLGNRGDAINALIEKMK
ncbi:MAG: uL30 family ribosomal protein [Candidatus Woesearchaeota archaeon]